MPQDSVTLWIRALEQEDESAAQALFDHYFDRLVSIARQKLGSVALRVSDEEDIAISALYSCLANVRSGQHPQIKDRDHLWRLLIRITEHRVSDMLRKHMSAKRGSGHVRGESAFVHSSGERFSGGIGEIPSREPTPQFAEELAEQYRRLLALLDDENLEEVARLVLAGYSTADIAAKTNRTQRTIQRRIKMIQNTWKHQRFLDDADD